MIKKIIKMNWFKISISKWKIIRRFRNLDKKKSKISKRNKVKLKDRVSSQDTKFLYLLQL